MTYQRSMRPINDTGGTTVNLARRPRRSRTRPRGGLGGFLDDIDKALGTNFSGGQDRAVDAASMAQAQQDEIQQGIDAANAGANPPATGASFVNKNGVCKPADRKTLDAVADLQKQLNRCAAVKGFTRIAVDGDLGNATLTLFRQVQSNSGFSVIGDATNCMTLGAGIDGALASTQSFADRLGAPNSGNVASPPPATTPSFVNPVTGQETKVPNPGSGFFGNISTPMKLAIGGVGLGIGYLLFFDKKRRR